MRKKGNPMWSTNQWYKTTPHDTRNYVDDVISIIHPLTRLLTSSTDEHYSLDSEDDALRLSPKNELHSPGRSQYELRSIEIKKVSFVSLVFSNKATVLISSRFYCRTIPSVICMTDFTAKMLVVIYFVILLSDMKPSFLKCDLRFPSALESRANLNLT